MIEYRPTVRQFFLIIALATAAPAQARQTSVTPEMDKIILESIEAIYRMDFDKADELTAKGIALDPEYPHAYLGAAATDLIRFAYGTELADKSLLASFDVKIQKTIQVAEAYLKKHPKDPDVLFVLGSAHGVSGRLAIVQRRWLKGFGHGRASMKYVRLAAKLDPELYDAQLGLGMFDYYVATIPKFAGWLAKIFLGGDREKGIKEIQVAAEKGRYAKLAAQLILVEIYLEDDFGARDTAKGLALTREIHARFPTSPMLDACFIVGLYEDGKLDEAVKEARLFQEKVKAGKYPAINLAKSHNLLGTLLWGAGDKEKALAEFRAGSVPVTPLTRWTPWNRVRAGQLLDALGRREEALAEYKAAYSAQDDWGYREIIKPCLKAPCVGAKYPGHFSPN